MTFEDVGKHEDEVGNKVSAENKRQGIKGKLREQRVT